jgi:hypothetical protein
MDGQGQVETIDALLRDNQSFAAYQGRVFGPIVDVRLDGHRIGDLPPTLGFTRDADQSVGEVVSVANVLVLQGYADVALTKGESPDFIAETSVGRLLIEHTRALTGYQEGSQGYLNRGMAAYREAPPHAAAVGNLSILLTMERSAEAVTPLEALEDPRPRGYITKSDAQRMMAEIRGLGAAGYFAAHADGEQHTIADADAKTLAKYRATVQASEALPPGSPGIQLAFRMWKPAKMSLLDGCVFALEEKFETVEKYAERPEWLVIQVMDNGGEWAYDLTVGLPETLGPFRKVLILYWHLGEPYVATWTAEGDTIVAEVPKLAPIPDDTDHRLHDWAGAVDEAMRERRMTAMLAANSNTDIPKRCTSPKQVEWYRRWRGRYPWVTCMSNGDSIRMRFSMADNWDGGEVVDVNPNDIAEAADRVWAFVFPSVDAASGDSM